MEIELKHSVPDAATFARLLTLTALGDYQLRPTGEQPMIDRYLDTVERALWQGGYACRLRERQTGRWRATVKGLGGAQGAMHQREEYETDVPPGALPPSWPDGPARRLVLRLAGSQPLLELFIIRQHRTERAVEQANRHVAELSLDEVEIEARGQRELTREVEVELKLDGTLADLQTLSEALQAYDLQPQPHSKFERALALLDSAAQMGE